MDLWMFSRMSRMHYAKCCALPVLVLLICVATIARPVHGAPATTSSPATSSCYSPISTSPSWFNTSGAWACPCSTSSSCSSTSSFSDSQFEAFWAFLSSPSPASLVPDATATLAEGADLAQALRQRILEENMHNAVDLAKFLDNKTLIARARETTSNFTDIKQNMQEQYTMLSVALVYLEQCRHDEKPLCERTSNLLDLYDALQSKILDALCKMWDILDAIEAQAPIVKRSVMPEAHRLVVRAAQDRGRSSWTPEDFRSARDYVVSTDVKAILLNAVNVLNGCDWTSV